MRKKIILDLSAKEIIVMSGVVLVYHYIPLCRIKEKIILNREKKVLSRLFDKTFGPFEKKFKLIDNSNYSRGTNISNRLKIKINIRFSRKELQLIQRALFFYIDESQYDIDNYGYERRNSLNVYHNGAEYGVDFSDYQAFNKKLSNILQLNI